jgi:CRISPR system Cascade subunit CasE
MHGLVANGFPRGKARQRVLWRIDRIDGGCYLLVQSQDRPDFAHIIEQTGWPASNQSWETKSLDTLLSRIGNGQKWKFKLIANPSRSIGGEEGLKRGKVVSHIVPAYQKSWLAKRAKSCGFNLEDGGFEVVRSEWIRFRKDSAPGHVEFCAATFEGVLEVSDAKSFCKALAEGIGKEKAYGCGLLTIAGLRRG